MQLKLNKIYPMKALAKYLPAAVLTIFGFMTLYLTSSIIFDLFGMREKQGDYVDFIIWVNFFCGLVYVASAYGFIKSKEWTFKILGLAFLILIITAISYYFYVSNGGIHKEVTYKALAFRTTLTAVFALVAKYTINKNNKKYTDE